jgi:multiple sugar transport system ATP-binding protein
MSDIKIDSVNKVYDDAAGFEVAVEEMNLDIHDGEFVVFVGPSGCGKSTTLRMLAGLEDITQGEIKIGDEIVNNLPPKDRDIAMVFQDYALYPHKTVRGNIAYGLQLSTNLLDEDINRRVEETATMMGIEDLLDKKPTALSGGQQQRVATGRAIVREPAVFLFDEPLSNLDAKLRTHMRTELSRLHSELGITSVYVTHDQEEAMTMADRIVVMNNGEIQQVGRPREIYYHPTNLFVSDFIGSPSINLLDVKLEDRDGQLTLVHDGFEYSVSKQVADRIEETGIERLTLGIRPENIRVVDPGEQSDPMIEARTDVVETVGSDNYLYIDIAGTECRARVSSRVNPTADSTVYVTFDESNIHLFDSTTEESIYHGSDQVATAYSVEPPSETQASDV